MMTLTQFRATGRDDADLSKTFEYVTDDNGPQPGRVYAGDTSLIHVDGNSWLMVWGNLQWMDTREVCEAILYIYACCERAEDIGLTADMAQLIGRFTDECDVEQVAHWVDAHPDSSCADDFMDVAPVAAEVYGDNHELDEDAIDGLIADFYEWAEQGAYATDETRNNGPRA